MEMGVTCALPVKCGARHEIEATESKIPARDQHAGRATSRALHGCLHNRRKLNTHPWSRTAPVKLQNEDKTEPFRTLSCQRKGPIVYYVPRGGGGGGGGLWFFRKLGEQKPYPLLILLLKNLPPFVSVSEFKQLLKNNPPKSRSLKIFPF